MCQIYHSGASYVMYLVQLHRHVRHFSIPYATSWLTCFRPIFWHILNHATFQNGLVSCKESIKHNAHKSGVPGYLKCVMYSFWGVLNGIICTICDLNAVGWEHVLHKLTGHKDFKISLIHYMVVSTLTLKIFHCKSSEII